jgi:hypothetical protein
MVALLLAAEENEQYGKVHTDKTWQERSCKPERLGARSSSSLKLVETLQRRGDVEALRPTKLIKTKLASWIWVKWVKKSESKREKPARSKAKKTRVSKPAPAKPAGTLLQMERAS